MAVEAQNSEILASAIIRVPIYMMKLDGPPALATDATGPVRAGKEPRQP